MLTPFDCLVLDFEFPGITRPGKPCRLELKKPSPLEKTWKNFTRKNIIFVVVDEDGNKAGVIQAIKQKTPTT